MPVTTAMRTFIVGFGRSGRGLHWPVLRGLRDQLGADGPWAPEPPLVWDLRDVREEAARCGLTAVASLDEGARLTDCERTVVHVCTPPAERLHLLERLAGLGFTQFLVEKPLAADTASLDAIDTLVRERGLAVRVISPWLTSELTRELGELIAGGRLGTLRSVRFRQFKARWGRTLHGHGHGTVFDVEPPHSVGVALRLAGDARLVGADWADMRCGTRAVSRMGRGRITLQHVTGVRTEIVSDLTMPTRERSVTLTGTGGEAVGHYPVSDADHYAQWTVRTAGQGRARRCVAYDDALAAYLLGAYRDFAAGRARPGDGRADDYRIGRRVVQLLQEAKSLAGAPPDASTDAPTDPDGYGYTDACPPPESGSSAVTGAAAHDA
ncbi:Gfo/Idh/MocA family oxidoreductase [Streptomyces tubbatahanensis]|uniref:Gfo/Idh/MocA family oxidoreductase n=1 Tax=Streptomyces tubbatahanensis TaxID=2923272 RepID=A0ABY3XMS4_9ACTN|nr:Gfo/Idh/MocA family oxidoreductase [Streptomyces tubbatahanensis]UNS95737.1 Gfo/Idh/MocA family oxidoreductase [Streptomyces tubbatahanensis]